MSYLCYLCLFAHSGVQHIFCCVYGLILSVYPMFHVSLDNPCLIVSSVFSNVYLTSPLLLSVSHQQREVI